MGMYEQDQDQRAGEYAKRQEFWILDKTTHDVDYEITGIAALEAKLVDLQIHYELDRVEDLLDNHFTVVQVLDATQLSDLWRLK